MAQKMSVEEMERVSELKTHAEMLKLGEKRGREIREKEEKNQKFNDLKKRVLQYKFSEGTPEEINHSLNELSLNGLISNPKIIAYLKETELYHLTLSKHIKEKNNEIIDLFEEIKLNRETSEENDKMVEEAEKEQERRILKLREKCIS